MTFSSNIFLRASNHLKNTGSSIKNTTILHFLFTAKFNNTDRRTKPKNIIVSIISNKSITSYNKKKRNC